MTRSHEENLARYAELTIRQGVALQPGQELLLSIAIENAPFARELVREAFRVGAKGVYVSWHDPQMSVIRYQEASDEALGYAPQWLFDGIGRAFSENAANLSVSSEDPGMLRGLPPERIAKSSQAMAMAAKPLQDYVGGFKINWCIVGAASKPWATYLFPNLSTEEALAKLWDAIFLTSRIYEPDPIAAWISHCETLEAKMAWLNEQRLSEVRFRGPGTDLHVGLVQDHVWVGGRGSAKNGVRCSPNVPTEEVFTMPHRERVYGVARSTKPVSVRGQVIDGIEVEFKDGRAIRATASQGQETLTRLLETDDSSARLGEVALVPNSSKVGQAGLLFFNTLYDENAACHIAFGASLGENLEGYDNLSPEERIAHGANDSLIHVDWMIGSHQIDVDGITPDGVSIPILRDGEWA